MAEPAAVVVKHDGVSLSLRFERCRIALGGEFAGNVDVDVACTPEAARAAAEQLTVRLPGGRPCGAVVGTREHAGGIDLGFWTEETSGLSEAPEHVEVLWGGTPIARLVPTLDESLPLESAVGFQQAAELLKRPPPLASGRHVLLAESREWAWTLLAAAMGMVAGLAWAALPVFEPARPLLAWLPAGVPALAIAAFAFRRARVPYRQVWLDRDTRRVLVLGRTRATRSELAEVPGRPLDDFDHVRLYMRWQITRDIDQDDQEVWHVTLEGPISHAGSDGRVHLHPDALLLSELRSEPAARRLAAEVAFHTGLRVLDTGHDGTA
ncbi:MAG: hypothetical protein ACQGVC_12275 [Myxococcota bacterium]